jgi:chemotaxis-related protein WspD
VNRPPSQPDEPRGVPQRGTEANPGRAAPDAPRRRPVLAEFQVTPDGEALAQVYDCWNTIGVAGNGSCQELLRFVHCRNCPVYSAAAIQLLDRPATADYRRECSEHYAGQKQLTTPAKTSVVIFRVISEWLALPTQAFQEVAERRAVHSLPHRRRDLVLGLVNVRGELLVCVSLGRLLGLGRVQGRGPGAEPRSLPAALDPRSSNSLHRLLVANWDGNRVAFPVEEVHGIHRVHWEQLREAPATITKSLHTYSRGVFAWRDHTVGFLDAEVLFSTLNRSLA